MSDDVTVLRDKIAEVIYNENPEIQKWDGEPYSFYEAVKLLKSSYYADLAYQQADALLEDFLIVHAPTVYYKRDDS